MKLSIPELRKLPEGCLLWAWDYKESRKYGNPVHFKDIEVWGDGERAKVNASNGRYIYFTDMFNFELFNYDYAVKPNE